MVIDYRLLNNKVVSDAFPMPSVEHAFANFQRAKVFFGVGTQLRILPYPAVRKEPEGDSICSPFGLFEFTKMPMEISMCCQVLSRVVDSRFGDLKHAYVYNFMNDLLVYSRYMEEHLDHLREVFRRLENAAFTLNRDKVSLALSEIKLLGHSLSSNGMKILPERVEVISQFSTPKNFRALRRFLRKVGFYANFVLDFSQLAEPLHALKGKNAVFVWDGPKREAFERLKSLSLCPESSAQPGSLGCPGRFF
jgi:hypothetical protein